MQQKSFFLLFVFILTGKTLPLGYRWSLGVTVFLSRCSFVSFVGYFTWLLFAYFHTYVGTYFLYTPSQPSDISTKGQWMPANNLAWQDKNKVVNSSVLTLLQTLSKLLSRSLVISPGRFFSSLKGSLRIPWIGVLLEKFWSCWKCWSLLLFEELEFARWSRVSAIWSKLMRRVEEVSMIVVGREFWFIFEKD